MKMSGKRIRDFCQKQKQSKNSQCATKRWHLAVYYIKLMFMSVNEYGSGHTIRQL